MPKTYKFVIDGRLPGLNDYQLACRRNKFAGAKMKGEQVQIVSFYIMKYLKNIHIENMVNINFKWIEKDRRRDKDNVSSFGRKIILDALVTANVLIDDGWKYIDGFTDSFDVDKNNPRIEIEIIECESEGKANNG